MKTLQECKDEVAARMGMTWDQVMIHHSVREMEITMGNVIRLCLAEACRDQREICREAFKISTTGHNIPMRNIEEAIKNAPEPKMI